MAKITFTNVPICLGTERISKVSNSLEVRMSRPGLDVACFEDDVDKVAKGPFQESASLAGYLDPGPAYYTLSQYDADTNSLPLIALIGDRTAGSEALMAPGLEVTDYNQSVARGATATFSATLGNSGGRFALGSVLWNSIGTSGITATANGTGVNLGAISSSQELVLQFHAFSSSGTSPNLDVRLVSDTSSGFSGPATSRKVIPQIDDGAGFVAHALTVDGAVTDTWWRLEVTAVGGTGSPTWHALAAAAIRRK